MTESRDDEQDWRACRECGRDGHAYRTTRLEKQMACSYYRCLCGRTWKVIWQVRLMLSRSD